MEKAAKVGLADLGLILWNQTGIKLPLTAGVVDSDTLPGLCFTYRSLEIICEVKQMFPNFGAFLFYFHVSGSWPILYRTLPQVQMVFYILAIIY